MCYHHADNGLREPRPDGKKTQKERPRRYWRCSIFESPGDGGFWAPPRSSFLCPCGVLVASGREVGGQPKSLSLLAGKRADSFQGCHATGTFLDVTHSCIRSCKGNHNPRMDRGTEGTEGTQGTQGTKMLFCHEGSRAQANRSSASSAYRPICIHTSLQLQLLLYG